MTTAIWQLTRVQTSAIAVDAARFQRRESVAEERIDAMIAAGVEHCGPPGFCFHRYEPIELWDDRTATGAGVRGRTGRGAAGVRAAGVGAGGARGTLWLLAGHYRLAVANRTGVRELEARIAVGWSETDAVAYAARSNARTKPYTPLEESRIYRDLADRGWTFDRVSAELDGRPAAYYRRRAALSYLCVTLQTAVRDGALRVEYGEAIGEAAREGLSASGQQYLRDLARTTGRRIEVFRAVVTRLVAAAGGQATTTRVPGALFDFDTETAVVAAQDAIRETTEALKSKDAWARFIHAGQVVLKGAPTQPEVVVTAVDYARARVTAIDAALGLSDTALVDRDEATEVVAAPLLKWVGSKRALVSRLAPVVRARLAAGTGRLIECFAGGAAVTLACAPRAGVLSDMLVELIEMYRAIQTTPSAVHEALIELREHGTTKAAYLAVRSWNGATPAERAARMIYLNRVGFNGLYRTNRRGIFNVPHGQKVKGQDPTPSWPTVADFATVSRALSRVELRACGWREALGDVDPGDTVYADPPYEGTYDGYGPKWTTADHDALAVRLRELASCGVHVVVSQPDSFVMRARYAWAVIEEVEKPNGYAVGGRGSRRAPRSELICTSRD